LGAPARARFDRLASWSESPDEGVKYFSGTAVYSLAFDLPAAHGSAGVELALDLGSVKNLAQVRLNGTDLGVLWKPPFRVPITGAVRAGRNELEVRITNLWVNRLIGDQRRPVAGRVTWTTFTRIPPTRRCCPPACWVRSGSSPPRASNFIDEEFAPGVCHWVGRGDRH